MANNENNPKEKAVFEQEISPDDLDAVAGGTEVVDPVWDNNCAKQHYRDIYEGGFPNCANTVEDGSYCSTNDACYNDAIVYKGMKGCSFADCHKAWE